MTDCTVKNPCVEKHYKSLTDAQRLETLYEELISIDKIRANVKREIKKIVLK